MSNQTKIMQSFQRDLRIIKEKLGKLLDMKMSNQNLLTDEEYLEKKNELRAQESRLTEQLRDNTTNIDRWLELAENVFDKAHYAQKIFETGTVEEKRDLIKSVGWNFFLYDKKLSFEIKNPFNALLKGSNNNNWWS